MYKVHKTNFNEWAPGAFESVNEALGYAEEIGFECGVYHYQGGEWHLVASWSPISGRKRA